MLFGDRADTTFPAREQRVTDFLRGASMLKTRKEEAFMRFSSIQAIIAAAGIILGATFVSNSPAFAYNRCQQRCVGQYHACQQEGGGGCYKIRQSCWNRCAGRE